MAPRAASSAPPSIGHGRIASFAELLAGVQLVAFATPDVFGMGTDLRPGVSPIEGLFLVPPFACIAASALSRCRREGLRVPLGWSTATVFVGSVLVVAGAALLGAGLPGPPIARLAILGFVVGVVVTGGGLVAMGIVSVADPAAPSHAGVVLLGWPIATLAAIGLIVILDAGTVVAAGVIPLGLALTISGSAWLVHSPTNVVGSRRSDTRSW